MKSRLASDSWSSHFLSLKKAVLPSIQKPSLSDDRGVDFLDEKFLTSENWDCLSTSFSPLGAGGTREDWYTVATVKRPLGVPHRGGVEVTKGCRLL